MYKNGSNHVEHILSNSSYHHNAKSFCIVNYTFVPFLNSSVYQTFFYQVAAMHNSFIAFNKFPSIPYCITCFSMTDHTVSTWHLIPNHTASMRHVYIPNHIAKI